MHTTRPALALLASLLLAACGPAATPPASASPSGTPTAEQAVLLAGIRLDLAGRCGPATGALPDRAIAGLDCRPAGVAVERARIVLFNRTEDVLAAYLAAIDAHGIALRAGAIDQATSEGAYTPGDDPAAPPIEARNAHWYDAQGHPHYLAIGLPFVLIEVDGSAGTAADLYGWTWKGNQDVPGGPTLWRLDGPADPNAKG